MSGTTGNRGYVYPTLADANDVPYYMQTLAEAVDLDIAALNNPTPITPTYEPGWGPYGGGTAYLGLTATRSSGGLVGLAGMFTRTGANLNTVVEQKIATLPPGYRPSKTILMLMKGYSTGTTYPDVRVDIYPDGSIGARWLVQNAWNSGSGASFVSLAGVSFVAGA